MKKRSFSLPSSLAAAAIVLAACSPEQTSLTSPADPALAAAPQASVARAPEFVPGEVIVRFRPGASSASRGEIMRAANAQVGEKIVTAAMRGRGDNEGISVLRTSMNVQDAIAALKARADVEYAEPNWIYTTDATVADTYYANGSLWGMYGSTTSPSNQYGIGGNSSWAAGKSCSNVVIGIIDEGYMYTHPELAANAFKNPGDNTFDGVDNDRNGYVDDVYGWDFAGNNSSVFDGAGDDHGTHVAGTIGAAGNGTGVVGVCSSVKLMSGKFLGSQGGTTANAVKAVDYFTDMKTRYNLNLPATSNSWGGGGFSQTLADAIGRANTANILFVAAAGNSTYNCDVTACYPANYNVANVISVASITSTGAISSFSNYGATTVDIGAPGSGIWSTVPVSSRGKVVAGYASYSGTSMATPHVSGAVALYASTRAGASAASIKSAILNSAIVTPSLSGKVFNAGRLNVSGF